MQQISFSGRVEKGEGRATKLGCPTANIAVEQGVIIPALGVYVGETEVDGIMHPSLVCINDGRSGYRLKMEVHLLDKNIELTGKNLNVVLLDKVRELIPFPGEEEMATIIVGDLKKAREYFTQQR